MIPAGISGHYTLDPFTKVRAAMMAHFKAILACVLVLLALQVLQRTCHTWVLNKSSKDNVIVNPILRTSL